MACVWELGHVIRRRLSHSVSLNGVRVVAVRRARHTVLADAESRVRDVCSNEFHLKETHSARSVQRPPSPLKAPPAAGVRNHLTHFSGNRLPCIMRHFLSGFL